MVAIYRRGDFIKNEGKVLGVCSFILHKIELLFHFEHLVGLLHVIHTGPEVNCFFDSSLLWVLRDLSLGEWWYALGQD